MEKIANLGELSLIFDLSFMHLLNKGLSVHCTDASLGLQCTDAKRVFSAQEPNAKFVGGSSKRLKSK